MEGKAWRENAVGDTSAGPIFHGDSWNEEKNPPGGQEMLQANKE